MALEFKNMATVDVVETVADNATVLIEEGGVIKRAPKSEVGGDGGEADLVLTVNNIDLATLEITADNLVITSGSVEDVWNAIKSGNKQPIVKLIITGSTEDGYMALSNEYITIPTVYGEMLWIHYMAINAIGALKKCFLNLNVDGSFNEYSSTGVAS